jgi:hypothetical protein
MALQLLDLTNPVGCKYYLPGSMYKQLLDAEPCVKRTSVMQLLLHAEVVLSYLQLLLLIGVKLEHIINKLAYEVATKHTAAAAEDEEGGVRMDGMVMGPSDDLFWFRSPRLVLILIHFVLFQNAFEFAFFFWTLVSTSIRQPMQWGNSFVSRVGDGFWRMVMFLCRQHSASTPARWTDRDTACQEIW